MKLRHLAFPALLLLAGLANAALPPLAADSAKLDQAYIPALMLSNSKDPVKAKASQEVYEKAWAEFAARQRAAKSGDPAWTKMFANIDKANAEARASIAAGKLTDAHNAQEEVRHELWHQRQAMGIEYQPDKLTDFHATMELLIVAVDGKEPAAINAPVIAKMREMLVKARASWQAVKTAAWSPAEYGLDGARLDAYQAAVAAEDKALDELAAALDANDGARIAKAAPAIKPPFAKAYGAFGVFPK